MSKGAGKKVVWQPLPGSQAHALTCPADFVLYHGTRGPGKTDCQLMFFRQYVGRGYGRFWRGVIFDREYKNLDDLVTKSKRWFPQFNDGAKFKESKADYKWTWPSGEELLFRQGSKESDYDQYHGHEYPFIGFNELTKQATPKFFNAIRSCNRSSFLPAEHSPNPLQPLPEIPLVVFATTNPHGVGHNWVKHLVIDKSNPGQIHRLTSTIYNPRTAQFEEFTRTQCHLFGSYKENRYLSPQYVAQLDAETDPNKRKAWLEGDWDIVAGGALDDVWNRNVHVVPRFKVPAGWRLDRSFDWGSTHPFSVGFWAEANGEEVIIQTANGPRRFCPPKGSLVRFWDWYGSRELGMNEGIKLGAKSIAQGIKSREKMLKDGGWICGDVRPGPADNQIFNVTEADTDSIATKMEKEGVRWEHSDKRAGSRINGLELVRERLKASLDGEGPGIYLMDCCKAAISTLPVVPRDPENPDDVDTESEDHCYDEVRYRCLASSNRTPKAIKSQQPT